MTRITQKTFKAALIDSGGNQSTIAQKIGVTRGAVNIYLSKNPNMRELLEIEAERIIDVAENVIDHDIVTNKNIDSSKWKLTNSKRGKARGYGAKTELDVKDERTRIIVEKADDANNKMETKPKAGTSTDSP